MNGFQRIIIRPQHRTGIGAEHGICPRINLRQTGRTILQLSRRGESFSVVSGHGRRRMNFRRAGTAKQTAAQNEREAEDEFGFHGIIESFHSQARQNH